MSKKNVLIVGASRGIGLGLVKQFLAEGDHVTATVRDKAKAADLDALAASSGGKVKIETVDTADAKSAERPARTARRRDLRRRHRERRCRRPSSQSSQR